MGIRENINEEKQELLEAAMKDRKNLYTTLRKYFVIIQLKGILGSMFYFCYNET